MAVKSSPETIREMKKDIQKTIGDLQKIAKGIRSGTAAIGNWDDAQAAKFNMLMQQIARLSEQPIETLNAALPKMERLAQSLDQYKGVKF